MPRFQQIVLAILLTALPFLAWDMLATALGHWAFSKEFTLGMNLWNLPFEEVLFFFTVPYASMYLLHGLALRFSEQVQVSPLILITLAALASLLSIAFWPAQYLVVVCLLTAVTLLVLTRKQLTKAVLLYYLIGFLLFFIVNSVLTALPVVTYDSAAISNIRVGTIPLEDFLYNFVLLSTIWLTYSYATKSTHAQ